MVAKSTVPLSFHVPPCSVWPPEILQMTRGGPPATSIRFKVEVVAVRNAIDRLSADQNG